MLCTWGILATFATLQSLVSNRLPHARWSPHEVASCPVRSPPVSWIVRLSGGLPCAIGVASLARPAPPRAFEQQRAVQPRAIPSGYRASHHRSPAKPTIGQSASFASRSSPHDLPFDCRSFSTMSEGAVTIRTKKFITNRLLQRKQFVRRAPRAQHAPFWRSLARRSPPHRSFSRCDLSPRLLR